MKPSPSSGTDTPAACTGCVHAPSLAAGRSWLLRSGDCWEGATRKALVVGRYSPLLRWCRQFRWLVVPESIWGTSGKVSSSLLISIIDRHAQSQHETFNLRLTAPRCERSRGSPSGGRRLRGGGNASSYSSELSEIGEVAYSDPDMLNPPQMPQEDADTYRAKAGPTTNQLK